MSTLKRIEANRRNAQRSTGPRTAAGKAVAKWNAVLHGLRAASPVVPGEDPAAWEHYRAAVVADLSPEGVLECELAERVAVLSWRLRRVGAFEAGVVALHSDDAVRQARGEQAGQTDTPPRVDARPSVAGLRRQVADQSETVERLAFLASLFAALSGAADGDKFDGRQAMAILQALPLYLPPRPPGMSDDYDDDEFDYDDDDDDFPSFKRPTHDSRTTPTHRRFLLALGVPEDLHADPHSWCGWTAGAVRAGAGRIARTRRWAGPKLLTHSAAELAATLSRQLEALDHRRRELAEAEGRAAADEAAARRRSLVPPAEVSDRVMRYEGHLQRQLTQTLHELERRQALRSDCPPYPPAAVDVTVHAADGVTIPSLGG